MTTKNCSRCETDKPLEDFIKRAANKDGYGAWCKQCAREYAKVKSPEYRAKHAEVIKERKKFYRENNLEKIRARDKQYRLDNIDSILEKDRERGAKQRREPGTPWTRYNAHCKRKYGITMDNVEQMMIDQKGICRCCRKPIPSSTPPSTRSYMHIDHCHTTGKVRGLLCHHCNITIGQVETVGLSKIVDYIAYHTPLTVEDL